MKIQKSLKVVLRIFAVVAMTWMLAAIPARAQGSGTGQSYQVPAPAQGPSSGYGVPSVQPPRGHETQIGVNFDPAYKERQLLLWLIQILSVFYGSIIEF